MDASVGVTKFAPYIEVLSQPETDLHLSIAESVQPTTSTGSPYTMRPIKAFLSTLSVAALLAAGPALAAGDTANGMRIFKKCKACHNLAKNKHKVGPTLVGLIGRKAGTAKDAKGKLYRYSKAMKAAGEGGIVWNADNLQKFLTKPKKFVPKTKMTFPGLKKPADRSDVIAYIKSQK